MARTTTENLGAALTALGLEDKFLSNGELALFPLVERGRIANSILAEKLRRGRWQGVIEMIYGGVGKADALFEGDREQLKRDIVESAKKDREGSSRGYINRVSAAVKVLKEKKEDDLLFALATSVQMEDPEFEDAVGAIQDSYFRDPVQGQERLRVIDRMRGQMALRNEKYLDAAQFFKRAGDQEQVEAMWDRFFSQEHPCLSYPEEDGIRQLEEIALSNEEKRESRLKKLVLEIASGNFANEPLEALRLYREHKVQLTEQEKKVFYEAVASKLHAYQIKEHVKDDRELALLWAQRHAKSDPIEVYQIFLRMGYEGNEVVSAVLAGLTHGREKKLDIGSVKEEHLRKAYKKLPFEFKVFVASHLKDKGALRELSKTAKEKGNFGRAYDLWVAGGGNLSEKYIDQVRQELIKGCLRKERKFFWHPACADNLGRAQLYEALVEDGRKAKNPQVAFERFEEAYDLVVNNNDEPRVQTARKHMISINSRQAIDHFSRPKQPDRAGIDQAVAVISEEYATDPETLRRFLTKYATQQT